MFYTNIRSPVNPDRQPIRCRILAASTTAAKHGVQYIPYVTDSGFDWPAWITAIASSLLVVAAFLALLGLLDARRTRHAQVVMDLSRRWDEPDIRRSRGLNADMSAEQVFELALRVYAAPGTPGRDQARAEFFDLWLWLNVIETIGALNREGAIADKTVFRMWGMSIAVTWDKWEDPVALMRAEAQKRGIYRNFEELAAKMKKLLEREKYGARI